VHSASGQALTRRGTTKQNSTPHCATVSCVFTHSKTTRKTVAAHHLCIAIMPCTCSVHSTQAAKSMRASSALYKVTHMRLPGGAKSCICASTRIPPLGSVDRNSVTSKKLAKELMCTLKSTCACVSVCTHTVYAGAAVPVTTAWPSPTDQARVCGRVVPNKCEARRKHFRWSIVDGGRRMSDNPLVCADRYAVQQ
jgi:hypothetical protein